MGVGIVVGEHEVLVSERENVLHLGVEVHVRQRSGLAGELQLHLLDMVGVDMRIAEGVDEVACAEIGYLRHHLQQKGIGGDVERHAEKDVRGALVELERQAPVRHVELEKRVAGRERHAVHLRYIPCADDEAPRVGIVLDLLYEPGYLVDSAALVIRPRAPLVSVHGTQVAVLVRPLVPYADAVFLQIADIGVALEKPQQFVDDGFEVQFFGGEEGETLFEVETHLMPEDGQGAGACAVFFADAFGEYAAAEIKILVHFNYEFRMMNYYFRLVQFVGGAEDFELRAAVDLVADFLLLRREGEDKLFVQFLLLRDEGVLVVERLVGDDGFLLAVAYGREAFALYTFGNEVVADRLRTLLGQVDVEHRVAFHVGVGREFDGDVGVVVQEFDEGCQARFGCGCEVPFAELVEDIVHGDGLADGREREIQLLRLAVGEVERVELLAGIEVTARRGEHDIADVFAEFDFVGAVAARLHSGVRAVVADKAYGGIGDGLAVVVRDGALHEEDHLGEDELIDAVKGFLLPAVGGEKAVLGVAGEGDAEVVGIGVEGCAHVEDEPCRGVADGGVALCHEEVEPAVAGVSVGGEIERAVRVDGGIHLIAGGVDLCAEVLHVDPFFAVQLRHVEVFSAHAVRGIGDEIEGVARGAQRGMPYGDAAVGEEFDLLRLAPFAAGTQGLVDFGAEVLPVDRLGVGEEHGAAVLGEAAYAQLRRGFGAAGSAGGIGFLLVAFLVVKPFGERDVLPFAGCVFAGGIEGEELRTRDRTGTLDGFLVAGVLGGRLTVAGEHEGVGIRPYELRCETAAALVVEVLGEGYFVARGLLFPLVNAVAGIVSRLCDIVCRMGL